MTDEKLLMFEAAALYYEKNMTQQEIASLMGLSRQTVSKLISDAVREKIVEIKINNPTCQRKNLAEELCKKYKIKNNIRCRFITNYVALRLTSVYSESLTKASFVWTVTCH